MANEYVVNLLDNATEQAVGEIKYAISPDYSRGVTRGEEIRISGTARWTQYAIRSIGYRVWWKEANGGTTYQDFEVNASIAIGATGKFELAFQIPDAAFDAMPTRVHKAEEDHGTYPIGDVDAYISVSSAPVQQWGDFVQARDERLVLLKYRLAPQILALDFERATPEGKWADDGQYLQCKALRLAVDPRAAAGDITKATIVCTGSDGSTRSANLTKEQLAAALTSEGYSETKPGIFADFASALGVDYTLTLTIGDAYDQTSRTDGVMRSFARLHLSGAKRGGVAVGMFSTSTDDHPKFEVDESHEAHFYGGISGVTNYVASEMPTGGHWVDGLPIYRTVVVVDDPVAGNGRVYLDPGIQIGELVNLRGTFSYNTGNLASGNFPQLTFYRDKNYVWQGEYSGELCVIYDASNGQWYLDYNLGYLMAIKRIRAVLEYTREIDGRMIRPRVAMSAATSAGCEVLASSQVDPSVWIPWRAFDKSYPTGWISAATDANPWIQLKMDVALRNITVTVQSCSNDPPYYCPIAGTIQGSNDGTQWEEIGAFSGWEGVKQGGLLGTIECKNNIAYSYVRLLVTEKPISNNWIGIGEMEISGDFDHSVAAAVADSALPEGPQIFEPYEHADPGVARADYIAMMSGIEIPDDADADAQADANGMESPGIDGEPEPGPSAHYDTVALYYRTETWSAAMVRNAVGRWITADEAAQILATQKESE